MEKPIKITCNAQDHIAISELGHFQGQLKTIAPEELEKLKKSILTYGFSFPIFIWQKNILDGHQRLKAVEALMSDGYEVPDLPVVHIHAADENEAAEKLLLINSRYAQISQSGFDDFIHNFDVDINNINIFLSIPDINIHGIEDFDIDSHIEGMPVFNQDEGIDDPILTVQLHFYDKKDIETFNQKTGLNISEKTRYINYMKPDLSLKDLSYE